LLTESAILVTHNYALVETCALVQNRLGLEALRSFQQEIVPLLTIEWGKRPQHESAVAAVLAANRKKLSLVDCVSFTVMRDAGIQKAFAFDRHFTEQGFKCL
jgi:predicted nucleic acid-binding protein